MLGNPRRATDRAGQGGRQRSEAENAEQIKRYGAGLALVAIDAITLFRTQRNGQRGEAMMFAIVCRRSPSAV
jgi:hypothetical protein